MRIIGVIDILDGRAVHARAGNRATYSAIESAAGVRIVMLTGDGKTTAEAVGRELRIDEVVAEVFPEDKASIVQRLRSEM